MVSFMFSENIQNTRWVFVLLNFIIYILTSILKCFPSTYKLQNLGLFLCIFWRFVHKSFAPPVKGLWSVRLLMFLRVSSAQGCIYSIKYYYNL